MMAHNASNVADPISQFTVTILDATNSPLNGATVTVDFTACCNDIKVATTQSFAGLTVVGKTVSAVTNVAGVATFRIEGAASDVTAPPIPGIVTPTVSIAAGGCATITATPSGGSPVLITNGIDHPTAFVHAWDLNGAVGGTGLNGTDLSLHFYDVLSTGSPFLQQRQRSDFNHNGVVQGNDSSLLAAVILSNSSHNGQAAFSTCP
ncbi:MAG: hypothetical protein ACRENS_11690 [Candidatus Eiseniibacteriota bacterium]